MWHQAFSSAVFEPVDRDEVWQLHKSAVSGADGFVDDDYFSDLEAIPTAYLRAGSEFLVGLIDDRVVVAMGGFLPRSNHTAEILRMRVDPAHQRSRVGTAVLDALERRAQELGFGTLVLQITLVQVAAQRCYEAQGYVATDATQRTDTKLSGTVSGSRK